MKKILIPAILAISALGTTAALATSSWVKPGVSLNYRTGPGASYSKAGSLHACSLIDVTGWQNGWAQFSHGGYNYWVSGSYLQNYACQAYTPKPKQHYNPPKQTYTQPAPKY